MYQVHNIVQNVEQKMKIISVRDKQYCTQCGLDVSNKKFCSNCGTKNLLLPQD
jgi:rRNA maturation endonuclease Nob1